MNKTVFIGDIHGRDIWKLIVDNNKDADRFVFIGDYFDSFDVPGIVQMANFQDIVSFKESSEAEVVLLIGNHDYHYFPEIGYNGTSGFQRNMYHSIASLVSDNRDHLKMAYSFDDVLCTHAGVSEVFMDNAFRGNWSHDTIAEDLNELFKHQPRWFEFTGLNPYGDDVSQTPIWIRPNSLLKASKKIKKKYKQVVGHTGMRRLNIDDSYFFIDTFDRSNEYLVKEDNTYRVEIA